MRRRTRSLRKDPIIDASHITIIVPILPEGSIDFPIDKYRVA